ncbi:MAG: hypothetical protein IPN34_15410 [Planctomycetes bacterium]|nr:hypothetical protein [Planctomycetota bacterium]
MQRPALCAIAAIVSFLLGLLVLGWPLGLSDRTAGSRDRWVHAALIGCALWLGVRGMWRNPRASRYLALAGFTCGCFTLVFTIVVPHVRLRAKRRPVPTTGAAAPAQANVAPTR